MALRNLIAGLMLSTVSFILFGQQSGQYVEPIRSTDPATDLSTPSRIDQAVSPRFSGDSNVHYILGPTDQFEVRSPEAEEIDHKQFRVRNDGNVLLPLVGLIHVAGMSCEELQVDLVRRLSKYIRTPQVFIKMTAETAWSRSGSRNLVEKPPLPASNQATTTSGGMATQELLTRGVPTDSRAIDTAAKGSIRQDDIYETPNIAKSTSTKESTTIASARLPISSSLSSPTITLPIEVIGPDGTVSSASFVIPPEVPLNQRLRLRMQIHGLRYETEASIKVNNSVWLPINSSSASIHGLASAYGGIGGGFHTFTLTINLPLSAVRSGSNTILFRFNHSDNIVSGYRVLAFNIEDSRGNGLIPASTFVNEDPRNWKAPSSLASDISAGEALWHRAPLTTPSASGMESIQAHCADCHSEDGRDLKYFNYSNNSIVARSVFHGLTQEQGTQIASYIRSLNIPSPGRPWNPPYQPGPGMDSQPVANWSAGAGLGAVLDSDAEMQQYLMPGGSTAGWAANQYLNPRELPISFQLLDWNSWLPQVSPMDAYGKAFTGSTAYTDYLQLRTVLRPNSTSAYRNALGGLFDQWMEAVNQKFITSVEPSTYTETTRRSVYSVALWQMVKQWELNQEFGLEAMPQVAYGAKANVRGWYGSNAFNSSPNILHMHAGPGLGNGSAVAEGYLAFIWYQTQLILNDGQGKQNDNRPLDYGYVISIIGALSNAAAPAIAPNAYLRTAWYVKCLQEETNSLGSPDKGWNASWTTPEEMIDGSWARVWVGVPPSTMTSLIQNYANVWFAQVSKYTQAQFVAGGWATGTDDPGNNRTDFFQTSAGGEIWWLLPWMRYYGVPASFTTKVASWAAQIWPAGNWALNNAATCSASGGCTSGF
jgi:hypothetical protein